MRLKEVQRWILHEILGGVPVHEAALGFTRGRSGIDHARRHSGQRAVSSFDLSDFFASVSAGRVFGILRTAGYEPPVAHVLTGLTTNTVPAHVWEVVHAAGRSAEVQPLFRLGRRLAGPHLPQGAPTSPALANLAAFRLDRRLTGLAASLGLRYSRYADDLTFSGPRLRPRGAGLSTLVASIAREEGFALNARKTALSTAAARQWSAGSSSTPPQRDPRRVRPPQGDASQCRPPRTGEPGRTSCALTSSAASVGSPHSTRLGARS